MVKPRKARHLVPGGEGIDMRNLLKNGLKITALVGLSFASPILLPSASAQMYLTQPDFRPGPIESNDPLVGMAIPGANAAEYRSHMLWNLRAGLNVAALQCQFSPYLRAVSNYNGLLAHHSAELASAYTVLNGYFKRVHGAKGQKLFDDYSTSTYNNFSTLHAQYGFCQVATDIAKQALATPKGQLHMLASLRMRELRNSLTPVFERRLVYHPPYSLRLEPPIPPLRADCWDKKNRFRAKCATA